MSFPKDGDMFGYFWEWNQVEDICQKTLFCLREEPLYEMYYHRFDLLNPESMKTLWSSRTISVQKELLNLKLKKQKEPLSTQNKSVFVIVSVSYSNVPTP